MAAETKVRLSVADSRMRRQATRRIASLEARVAELEEIIACNAEVAREALLVEVRRGG